MFTQIFDPMFTQAVAVVSRAAVRAAAPFAIPIVVWGVMARCNRQAMQAGPGASASPRGEIVVHLTLNLQLTGTGVPVPAPAGWQDGRNDGPDAAPPAAPLDALPDAPPLQWTPSPEPSSAEHSSAPSPVARRKRALSPSPEAPAQPSRRLQRSPTKAYTDESDGEA